MDTKGFHTFLTSPARRTISLQRRRQELGNLLIRDLREVQAIHTCAHEGVPKQLGWEGCHGEIYGP